MDSNIRDNLNIILTETISKYVHQLAELHIVYFIF